MFWLIIYLQPILEARELKCGRVRVLRSSLCPEHWVENNLRILYIFLVKPTQRRLDHYMLIYIFDCYVQDNKITTFYFQRIYILIFIDFNCNFYSIFHIFQDFYCTVNECDKNIAKLRRDKQSHGLRFWSLHFEDFKLAIDD